MTVSSYHGRITTPPSFDICKHCPTYDCSSPEWMERSMPRKSNLVPLFKWRNVGRIYIVVLVALQIVGKANAEEISEAQHSRAAVIGSAYDSSKESFVGSRCVEGDVSPTGGSESALSLDQSMSNTNASRELGFAVGARARYGVYEGSMAASFLAKSTSTDFSVSSIYSAVYSFPKDKLVTPKLNAIGISVAENYERWAQTCGTKYVDEIRKGGRFYFSVRIDFSSQSEKKQFDANFKISGPAAGMTATLKDASEHFSSHTKVTVSVYQYGGDVERVSGIFSNSRDGRKAYIQCSLGHFDACAMVIQNALAYATDIDKGFPSQLKAENKRAVISYDVTDYAAAGLYKNPPPFLDQVVMLKRRELAQQFEEQYRWRQTVDAILNTNPGPPRHQQLKEASALLDQNLAIIVKASTTCYETPASCPNAVDTLKLAEIHESVFQSPSFGELCRDAYLGGNNASKPTIAGLLLQQSADFDPYSNELPLMCCDPRAKTGAADCRIEERHIYMTVGDDLGCCTINLGRKFLFDTYRYTQKLTDISALQCGAEGNQILDVSGHSIEKIDVLALFSEMQELDFSGNKVADIRPLGMLRRLRSIRASDNEIADVAPLDGLPDLESLNLAHNLIVDVSSIQKAPRLMSLDLSYNQISDIGPLSALPELEKLDVRHNLIKSLANFRPQRLKQLRAEENQFPFSEVEQFCQHAPSNLEITYLDEDGQFRVARCVNKPPQGEAEVPVNP